MCRRLGFFPSFPFIFNPPVLRSLTKTKTPHAQSWHPCTWQMRATALHEQTQIALSEHRTGKSSFKKGRLLQRDISYDPAHEWHVNKNKAVIDGFTCGQRLTWIRTYCRRAFCACIVNWPLFGGSFFIFFQVWWGAGAGGTGPRGHISRQDGTCDKQNV